MAKDTKDRKSEEMSEPQRLCLLHVLRNVQEVIINSIYLLERKDTSPSIDQMLGCLEGLDAPIANVVAALRNGSFCSLAAQECEFVSKHVGCDPAKRGTAVGCRKDHK